MIIQKIPSFSYPKNQLSFCANKKLDKKDKRFFDENFNQSPYYSTEDFIQAYNYFKNVKTKENKGIFNKETLSGNYKKYYPKNFKDDKEDVLTNNLEKLLKINPSSIQASYIQTLIELIQSGDLNPSALRNFASNWRLSDEIIEDIELFYKAIEQNKDKTKLQQDLKNLYIPTFNNEKEAIENSEIGDVFVLKGEQNIQIKSDDNNSTPINLSPDSYFELFKPIERFATSQQLLGDCYLIETLNILYQNPSKRAIILKLFKEDNKGNITIEFPNTPPVKFEGKNLPDGEDEEIYCAGAKGFKLLEYAFGKTLLNGQIEAVREFLKKDEKKLEDFNHFIKENKDDVFINTTSFEPSIIYDKFSNQLDKIQETPFDNGKTSVQYLIGNGGGVEDVFAYLEHKGAMIEGVKSLEDLKETLKKADLSEENLITLASKDHIFGIQARQDKNNKTRYYCFDPHNQALPFDITEEIDLMISLGLIEHFCIIK